MLHKNAWAQFVRALSGLSSCVPPLIVLHENPLNMSQLEVTAYRVAAAQHFLSVFSNNKHSYAARTYAQHATYSFHFEKPQMTTTLVQALLLAVTAEDAVGADIM